MTCVDSSRFAAWAATRLSEPVELLHVLERHAADLSGRLGVDARELLLQQLVELDEQRNRLAQEAGRHLLDEAAARAREGGVDQVLQASWSITSTPTRQMLAL